MGWGSKLSVLFIGTRAGVFQVALKISSSVRALCSVFFEKALWGSKEYNITTIVITHDMNSVLEIGDQIVFIYKGQKWWEGNKEEILKTENTEVIDFVYASEFMQRLKKGSL